MIVKLTKLAESLEKNTLLEKYSDSMPAWLQNRLDYSQAYNRYRQDDDAYPSLKKDSSPSVDNITGNRTTQGYLDSNDSKSSKLAKKHGYKPISHTYRGSSNSMDDQRSSLYYNFRKMGIPLDKVKVEEGPMPSKRTDDRLKEPNIPIFLFSNGQVYAKGVNDSEDYADDAQYRPFKYLPMKQLLSDAIAFAYIDGNDSSNFNASEIRRNRQTDDAKEWRKYERNRSNAVSKEGAINRGFDKSGYPMPIDKWEKSNKTYITEYMKKQLNSYRERIVDAIDDYKVFQSTLLDKLKDANIDQVDYYGNANIAGIYSGTQTDIRKNLLEAKYSYSYALRYAEENDEKRFENMCAEINSYLAEFNRDLEETGIMPKKLATIDWI